MTDAALRKPKPYKMIKLDRVHPNTWNPNEMTPGMYKTLKAGITRTLEESGRIPPIVVRRMKPKGNYEIIDGYHRWKILDELGEKRVGVFVVKVSDKTARILTDTLNYVKGSPNRQKYAQGLIELIEIGASVDELEELLPESPDELDQLMEEADISIKALEALEDDDDGNPDELKEDDPWVDMKFRVSVEQAKVIEQELARIGGRLKGKAKRARAMEFMAVQSSQTPIPDDLV